MTEYIQKYMKFLLQIYPTEGYLLTLIIFVFLPVDIDVKI